MSLTTGPRNDVVFEIGANDDSLRADLIRSGKLIEDWSIEMQVNLDDMKTQLELDAEAVQDLDDALLDVGVTVTKLGGMFTTMLAALGGIKTFVTNFVSDLTGLNDQLERSDELVDEILAKQQHQGPGGFPALENFEQRLFAIQQQQQRVRDLTNRVGALQDPLDPIQGRENVNRDVINQAKEERKQAIQELAALEAFHTRETERERQQGIQERKKKQDEAAKEQAVQDDMALKKIIDGMIEEENHAKLIADLELAAAEARADERKKERKEEQDHAKLIESLEMAANRRHFADRDKERRQQERDHEDQDARIIDRIVARQKVQEQGEKTLERLRERRADIVKDMNEALGGFDSSLLATRQRISNAATQKDPQVEELIEIDKDIRKATQKTAKALENLPLGMI